MKDLEKNTTLHRHDFHGEWNYTVNPGTQVRVLFFHAHLGQSPEPEGYLPV